MSSSGLSDGPDSVAPAFTPDDGPRISAIIPNYNHGATLARAVSALLDQTRPPIEVIVVDDGSTDDSRDVAARLAAGNPRVRLIVHEENRGAIAALNTGIEAARGTHVYLGAADDAALPRLLEVLAAAQVRYPGLGLYSGELRRLDKATGGAAIRPVARPSFGARAFTPAQTADLLHRIDNFILTGAAIIDREKLFATGGLQASLGSFADGFMARQLALRHGFVFVPKILAEWHVAAEGYSRSTAASPDAVGDMIVTATRAFAADPAFPPGYGSLFARRWTFGVLRLAIADAPAHRALIKSVASPAVAKAIFAVSALPVVGRPVNYAILYAAYRPFSLLSILATSLSRWMNFDSAS